MTKSTFDKAKEVYSEMKVFTKRFHASSSSMYACRDVRPSVSSLKGYNTNTSTLSSDIADAGSSVGGVCVGRLE